MDFLLFLKGRADFLVKTDNPEYAIDKLRSRISLMNIEISEGEFSFSCFFSGQRTAEDIISELGGQIVSVKKSGIPYILSRYRKRTGLFAGAVFMVAGIYASSFFVWDISVEGNENVTDEEIIAELEKTGFKTGVMKKSVDIDSCVNRLLVNEDRISWAAINFEGTLAHVEVTEARIGKKLQTKENVNLVASHDGIIIRADALDGSAVVEKGDVVTKGQLLVSAYVERRMGGSRLTGAKGFVWANTERSYCVRVPLVYLEKNYTGKKDEEYTFLMLGKDVGVPDIFKRNYENSEEIVRINKVCFGKNFSLPFKIITKTTLEYKCLEKTRTTDEALETAKQQAQLMLKRDSAAFVLARQSENYEVKDGCLVYTCVFEGVENIARELEFELS